MFGNFTIILFYTVLPVSMFIFWHFTVSVEAKIYLRKLHRRSRREIARNLGVTRWNVLRVILILVMLGATLLLADNSPSVQQNLASIIMGELVVIVVLMLSIPILAIAYMPSVIHRENKILLTENMKWKEPIDAQLEIEPYPVNNDWYFRVRVTNSETEDLQEPELFFNELGLIDTGGELTPMLEEISKGDAPISWHHGAIKNKVIRGGRAGLFNVAHGNYLKLEFLFDDGTVIKAAHGIYKAIVTINGRLGLENKKIRPVSKKFYLGCLTRVEERKGSRQANPKSQKYLEHILYIYIGEDRPPQPDEKDFVDEWQRQ